MTRRSHGPWLDNLEPTPEPPMNPQTLRDHAPILDALQQLTALAPGLPASHINVHRYADGGWVALSIHVGVESLDELALWKSALGGVRADLPREPGDWNLYHRVTAQIDEVAVEVNWVEEIPAAEIQP